MQFFMASDPRDPANGKPPTPEIMERMAAFVAEGFQNGTLVSTGAMDPRKKYIANRNGQITVTDGPYTEAKEAIVGWAIVSVDSEEEAIELSRRFYEITGEGSGTIQRIYEMGDFSFQDDPELQGMTAAS
jgi:hypothetical protein